MHDKFNLFRHSIETRLFHLIWQRKEQFHINVLLFYITISIILVTNNHSKIYISEDTVLLLLSLFFLRIAIFHLVRVQLHNKSYGVEDSNCFEDDLQEPS